MSAAERFEEYIKRLAEARGVSPEEIVNLKIVQEYKKWIDKELG